MKVLKGRKDDVEINGITRREMLKGVGSVGAGALLGSGFTTLPGARRESGISQGAGSERPWYVRGELYRRANRDEHI